jgi:hypothetical protein
VFGHVRGRQAPGSGLKGHPLKIIGFYAMHKGLCRGLKERGFDNWEFFAFLERVKPTFRARAKANRRVREITDGFQAAKLVRVYFKRWGVEDA